MAVKKSEAIKLWLPVYIYAGLIFALSSMPRPRQELLLFPSADKAAHLFEYALLGILLARAFKKTYGRMPVLKCIIISAAIAALYGILDEFHQYFVPTRSASAFDALFDFLGGLSGAVFYGLRKA